jgi:hypothetical protein
MTWLPVMVCPKFISVNLALVHGRIDTFAHHSHEDKKDHVDTHTKGQPMAWNGDAGFH